MLITLQEVLHKYNLSPKGVIHVGAHWGEEYEDYKKCGVENVLFIEPCKEAVEVLVAKFKHYPDVGIIQCACGAIESEMPMYVSHQNQGQSNSLLEPQGHLTQHPEIVFDDAEVVKVTPLDKLGRSREQYQMLVMDVQGYEGEVLRGATETLKNIDIVYTEVNNGETYTGNALIGEIDELLSDFTRVETYWPSPNWTWGDAIYIRKTLL